MSWVLSAFADEAGDTTQEQIDAIERAGLKHIDVRGIDGHNIATLPLDEAKAIREKLDAAGITVAMFGSPLGKVDIADPFEAEAAKLAHMGKLAPVLGCNAIRIFSYYNKAKVPKDRWKRESLDRLGRLKKQAADLGLILYHENERHIYGDRCPEVLDIAEALRDGKTFRLIFDFDNYNQSGDDVWDNWTKLADHTDAFHLKDSDEHGQHVPIGEGNGDARRILADAVKRGWSGPLSLEPHLRHSAAVLATHAGGSENQSFQEMSRRDVFNVAAEAAISLLGELKAPVA